MLDPVPVILSRQLRQSLLERIEHHVDDPMSGHEPEWILLESRADIDAAIQAAKQFSPSKLQVVTPERPGVHGHGQPWWWGVGVIGSGSLEGEERIPSIDVPGFGLAGFLGNYWNIHSGIDVWSVKQHMKQVNMMTHLANILLNANLEDIQPFTG